MNRRRRATESIVLLGSLGILSCASIRGTPHAAIAEIPRYDVDSVLRSPKGELSAMVGTISDSASGRPLGGAILVLTSGGAVGPYHVTANEKGGFVLGGIQVGQYKILVRRVGYGPYKALHDARRGVVDTLHVRLPRRGWCEGMDCY